MFQSYFEAKFLLLVIYRTSWLDRDTLIKKYERSQKEVLILQQKLEDAVKKDVENKEAAQPSLDTSNNLQVKIKFANLLILKKSSKAHI